MTRGTDQRKQLIRPALVISTTQYIALSLYPDGWESLAQLSIQLVFINYMITFPLGLTTNLDADTEHQSIPYKRR